MVSLEQFNQRLVEFYFEIAPKETKSKSKRKPIEKQQYCKYCGRSINMFAMHTKDCCASCREAMDDCPTELLSKVHMVLAKTIKYQCIALCVTVNKFFAKIGSWIYHKFH